MKSSRCGGGRLNCLGHRDQHVPNETAPALPSAQAPRRFEALDSWRGLAAIMVVLFHNSIDSHLRDASLVRAAEVFVDFFFVLSGFVIAHAYAERIRDGAGFRAFVVSRIARLMPLHLFMLALFVAFEVAKVIVPQFGNPADPAFSGADEPAYILGNLLMLQSFWPAGELSWNTPAWSISAEFAAYVAFGLLALFAGRRLFPALLALALAAPLILAGLSEHGIYATNGYGWARALFGFSLGAALQMACGPALAAFGPHHTPALARRWTMVELAAIALALAGTVLTHGTAWAYAMPLVFVILVAVFAVEGGAVSRALKHPALLLLGALSYSIYLTHLFIQLRLTNAGRLLDHLAGTHVVTQLAATERYGAGLSLGSKLAGDGLTLAMLALVVAASFLTWTCVERPGQRWMRDRAARLIAWLESPAPVLAAKAKGRLGEAAL